MRTITLRVGKAFICFHEDGFYGRMPSGSGISLRYVGRHYKALFSERHGFRKAHYWMGFRMEKLEP